MDAGRHPLIEVITNAEVVGCEGEAGEFKVRVRKNPRFVHEELCVAFIRQYHTDLFPRLLEDTSFNRWRRVLMRMTDAIRRCLTATLSDPEDWVRVVDSAPIPLYTYTWRQLSPVDHRCAGGAPSNP